MSTANPNSERVLTESELTAIHAEAVEMERGTDGKVNAADYERMLIEGAKAWADVPDVDKWLDELRGNSPS